MLSLLNYINPNAVCVQSFGVIEGLSLDNCTPIYVPQHVPLCARHVCVPCAMQKGRILEI